ncbi:hypothetical protein AwWohl_14340 [Gammaproteobacteria bacterium]|nr:hypothetical protein AwWohl_14340 [Gammaproteobacteria bacterium]
MASLIVILIIFIFKIIFKIPNHSFTSVFQGSIRYNSYIFIALAYALFGDAGLALAGFFMAYMIVLNNLLCISCMNIFGSAAKTNPLQILIGLIKNPLMIGALTGLFLNKINAAIPDFLMMYLTYLAAASMVTSCLAVGAGLTLKMNINSLSLLGFSTLAKLLLLPLITYILLKYLQAPSGTAFNLAMLYAAVPCAGNAYILARQMGGDAPLMASIITWTTLGACISIPIIISMVQV